MTNQPPVSILLVDDDEDDYLIVRKLIAKISDPRYELEWIDDCDTAAKVISEARHQIYLIDYRLGATTGIELLKQFDLHSRDEPFIILTGVGDRHIEQEALDIGISDYLVKGNIDDELLARVLRYSLQRKTMEMQRIKYLEEVNTSKDEFIALASHQLRTPATAVKQFIGMMLEGYAGELTDNQISYLEKAFISNERQLKIVDDILKVARLDLNQINLKQSNFTIEELFSDISKEMTPLLSEKDQTLMVAGKMNIALHGDREHLGMALSNLIDNASKYSGRDSEITIRSTPGDTDKTVAIDITDPGVGIDPMDYDKLFIKFSRIPNPVSVEAGGNGLGLYWSKEIVQLHQGTIAVQSEVNKGTTFTVSLPVAIS